MGLLDTLTTKGSVLTPYNGVTPDQNSLSTNQSDLQVYSVTGVGRDIVNKSYQQYADGVVNNLPQPSQLDLNGTTPSQYILNQPE